METKKQPKMDKETAKMVLKINVQDRELQQMKWDLKNTLGFFSWEEATTAAMKFMMGEGK